MGGILAVLPLKSNGFSVDFTIGFRRRAGVTLKGTDNSGRNNVADQNQIFLRGIKVLGLTGK
jgi:hypothetical protein